MKKMRKWDFRNWRIMRWTSIHPSQLNERFVLLNLLATQSLVLVLAVIFILLQKNNAWSDMFSLEAGWVIWPIGILFAAVVLLVNAVVDKMAPPEVTDDGGLNRLLFGRRPLWQILLLSLIVAICEELLFRGALQHTLGWFLTSVLFAVIHFRYLRHWLTTGFVFGISCGLGWLYIATGTLWAPIVAHFFIDAVGGCIIRWGKEDAATDADPDPDPDQAD